MVVNIIRNGIRAGAEFVLNKDTVKILETVYNEVVPKAVEIVKTARSLR